MTPAAPRMDRKELHKMIISVINQKGGVGKTTTALQIGAFLRQQGKKVLYIDLDGQCNLSYSLQANTDGPSVADVLAGECSAKEATQTTPAGEVIPSSPGMAAAESIIGTKNADRLKSVLAPIQGSYDYIVMDTPPALGTVMINALTASDGAIITAQADIYSVQGIAQMAETIATVKRYTNKNLEVWGILLTRYSGRAVLTREMETVIGQQAEKMGTTLFHTRIRENVRLKEAATMQQDIYTYAPKSNGAADYTAFMKELEERMK